MKAVAGTLAGLALLGMAGSRADAHGTTIITGGHPRTFHATSPATRIIVVPRTVYVQTYVAPTAWRWVPGYWTYQWVPQLYTHHVWVPGHYNVDGAWVEGRYQPQSVQTGYYQPLWIGGYWTP